MQLGLWSRAHMDRGDGVGLLRCEAVKKCFSDGAGLFDDEDARGSVVGVCDVFVTDLGHTDPTRGQALDLLRTLRSVVHVDLPLEDDEHLGPVIDVPDVGLVGPVQAHGCIGDSGEVGCRPGSVSGEFAGVKKFHGPPILVVGWLWCVEWWGGGGLGHVGVCERRTGQREHAKAVQPEC